MNETKFEKLFSMAVFGTIMSGKETPDGVMAHRLVATKCVDGQTEFLVSIDGQTNTNWSH